MLLYKKLNTLSNTQLITLAQELQSTTVEADALIYDVIKDTEVDTTAPMLAFVAVGQNLAFVLAERLKDSMQYSKKRMTLADY